MGKPLLILCLVSLVAIVTMGVVIFKSYDHRERAQLQRDVLATKTAESRDSPASNRRNDAIDLIVDSVSPEDSKLSGGSGDLPEFDRGEGSSSR